MGIQLLKASLGHQSFAYQYWTYAICSLDPRNNLIMQTVDKPIQGLVKSISVDVSHLHLSAI